MGQRSHFPKDPAESAEERQRIPQRVSVSGRTMAGDLVMTMTAAVMEGFEEELARAEQEIAKLQARLDRSPGDLQSRVRLAYRMNHRASLSGRMADLEQTLAAVTAAIQGFGPKEDLCLLKANLDAHLHRIANAREDLAMAPCLAGRFEARAVLAGLDFREGRD